MQQQITCQEMLSLCIPTAHPARKRAPHSSVRGTHGSPGDSEARLDVRKLESRASFFFVQGLASSSQKTYKSGENRYLQFLPVVECGSPASFRVTVCASLCHFLADQKLKQRTIKTYLSGVRYFPDKIWLARSVSQFITCLTWSIQ